MRERKVFITLPSSIWTTVLLSMLFIVLGALFVMAAPGSNVAGKINPNQRGQYTVITSDNQRYYAVPGSTEIQLLNARNEIVAVLPIKDETGRLLPIYGLAYDPATRKLLVNASPEVVARVYAVDVRSGFAVRETDLTYRVMTDLQRDLKNLPQRPIIPLEQRHLENPWSGSEAAREEVEARESAERAHGSNLDTPGSALGTVTVPVPASFLGVSVAVDCEGNIYYTNYDQTNLYKINLAGTLLSTTPLVDATTGGAVRIDEMSWDAGREMLWGASGWNIYLVNPATGICTFRFVGMNNGYELTDGIAFDPTDGTIWHTTDISNDIWHFSATGTFLGALAPLNVAGSPDQDISGVCVGTDNSLYVGHNGRGIITRVNKTTGAWISDFYTPGGRDEGLECDAVNFAPNLALWSKDAYNNTITAIEVNAGSCECVPLPGAMYFAITLPGPFTCNSGVVTPTSVSFPITVGNAGPGHCHDVSMQLTVIGGPGGTATVTTINPVFIGDLEDGQSTPIHFTIELSPTETGGVIVLHFALTSDCGPLNLDVPLTMPPCPHTPGPCGPMDIVFAVDITGSMGGAIGNVISALPNIMSAANAASGGDVRFGLLTFDDLVHVIHNLTTDQTAVATSISGLFADGGWNEPEASDETLREIITRDALCTDGSEFTSTFRNDAVKIIVLITDARPGGCDDDFAPGVDDVNAHQRALDALASNILISSVFIPTWPDFVAEIIPIMNDYAATTGGAYMQVNSDGSGTGDAIAAIIEHCGTSDECDGPHCSVAPDIAYRAVSGLISDAVVQMTETNEMKLSWTPVEDADFYQVYMGRDLDAPQNWAPVGTPLENSLIIPQSILDDFPTERTQYFYVQAKQVSTEPIASDLACWPMDEGSGSLVEDMSQDHDGTIHGAEWATGPSGNGCLHFEHGDYVDLQNDIEFYGHPLQVEACVSIASYPTVQTGAYYIFSCHRYATWFQGFGLRVDVNGRLLSEVWDQEINNWRTLWAPITKQVPLNEPFKVTAVINGNHSMILLNGEVVAAGVQDYNSITNGFHMTIGAHNYNDNRHQYHMRGDIHWLKISQY
jgi:hypothetical protein